MSTSSPATNPLKGALLALAAFATFSAHDVLIKQLSTTYTAFQIVFFTSLFAMPVLTLVLIQDPRPDTLRPQHPYWMAVRSVASVAAGLCAFYAIGELPLAQVYAFIFTAPLLITLLAIPILGETVRLRRGIAVGVGLIGVFVVLQPGTAPLTWGHIAALCSAFAGAMVSIIVRKIGKEERSVLMILYPMMANLAFTAAMMPFVYVPVSLVDLGILALDSMLVLAAMGLLVGAYLRADAVIVAPMQYSQMIWATIFGIFIFNESPGVMTYVGTAIIAASGLYILKREASGSSNTTPVMQTRTRIGHAAALRVGYFLRKHK